MQFTLYRFKQVPGIILLGITVSLSACNDQPKQQHGEVAIDTLAGNDELIIDTTADISYGTVGEAPTVAPDLDTLTYIDRGIKPDEIFEEEDQ